MTGCACNKRCFTEQEAKTAVLEAKIRRGLRGKAHRREERAYPCPDEPAVWHVTSRADATGQRRGAES